jgi:NADPH-dependent 2,4-dienoyl-CoA reductase/sulfur reductase-like enzyme
MAERLVVVGGDAAGMTAASQARRRRGPDDLEIIAFERTARVSYSACGEPYHIAGYVPDLSDLEIRSPARFARDAIEVRLHHEVIGIDTAAGFVTVRDLEAGTDDTVGYDHLMYATGGRAIVPGWPGIDLDGIHALRTLDDAAAIRASLLADGTKRVVVAGGGYIGLEVAEAVSHLGIEVTVLTLGPGVMERTLDEDMGARVMAALPERGIAVRDGIRIDGFSGKDGRVTTVHTSGGEEFPADLVLLGLGTAPETALAETAGIPLGDTGAVAVDDRQRTDAPGVWSAGDCAEARHRVTGRPVNLHLGTVANKAGRVAGINIGGGDAAFPGVLGTAITRVFDLEIARTGLTEAEASDAGFDAVSATIESTTASGYWPDAAPMWIKTVVERGTGRFLGAQIIGGPTAGKRIDVLATVLWSGMPLADLEMTDLSYAPPFSSTWEPVQIAARKGAEAARG